MYVVTVINDSRLETKMSNIFYKKPSLSDVYESIGSPSALFSRYYKWRIIVSKIENFRRVYTVSYIDYCDVGKEEFDYVQSGNGYLFKEHELLTQQKEKEKKVCGN